MMPYLVSTAMYGITMSLLDFDQWVMETLEYNCASIMYMTSDRQALLAACCMHGHQCCDHALTGCHPYGKLISSSGNNVHVMEPGTGIGTMHTASSSFATSPHHDTWACPLPCRVW